ncbi:MAG: hypothetical protein ACXVHB_06045 [Solirubrobacteraceae bacterium]
MTDNPRADKLPHTRRIEGLLKEGKLGDAINAHNAHLDAEFKRAARGEAINLSDLMAAKDEIDVDGIKRRT